MVVISEASEPFSSQFGYVMIVGALLATQVVIFARVFGGVMARKVFTKKFMDTNFGQIHKETFGEPIGVGGFPDNGNGYYSRQLDYKSWVQCNNAQRVHLHFVQWIATYLFLLACAGVYYPRSAASIGFAIFLVRIWYALGYVIQGPKGRVAPFIISVILTVSLSILSILSGIQHIVR